MRKLTATLLTIGAVALLANAADEVQVTTRLALRNGTLSVSRNPNTLTVDQDTLGMQSDVQIIGTNWEAVTFGDLVVPRWAYMMNLATSANTGDFIRVGVRDATTNYWPFMRLEQGESAVLPLWTNVTLYAIAAGTNNVKLDKLILED